MEPPICFLACRTAIDRPPAPGMDRSQGEGADGTSCRIVEARSDCAARVISWRFYRTGGARLSSPSRVRLRSGFLGGCREFRASAGRHGTRLIEPGESLQFDLNSLIICPEFAVPDPRAVTSTG